jgi:uncharacterized protein YcbK (DUF882 family)
MTVPMRVPGERRRVPLRERPGVDPRTVLVILAAGLGVLQFSKPARDFAARPFAAESQTVTAESAPDAFGRSGEVKVRFALPGAEVEFPLVVHEDPASLRYQWVAVGDTVADALPRVLGLVRAPTAPGFYQLAVLGDGSRQILAEPVVAVIVPYHQKVGGLLNGYRIGLYRGRAEAPDGFLEVHKRDMDMQLTKHLRVRHFITKDRQNDVWPKYVALSPLLLDKIELVIAEVEKGRVTRGGTSALAFGVNSGFRTPAHNATIRRAAGDSRHQYGDAADVVMDANGDGKITMTDGILIALAVERVEDEHPDLAGGLGLYTSARYRTPYVHIDARGRKTRWRG